MTRQPLFLVLFTVSHVLFQTGLGQSANINGEVRDSVTGYTISGVTVAAYLATDSSLLDVQLTDNTGRFTLIANQSAKEIDIYVSSTGYQIFHRAIHIDSGQSKVDIQVIKLTRNYEHLSEVIIHIAPPVSMNGDTLEINPAAFRMSSGAVVEDLLRKVRGVVVWGDGTITVNGRKVDYVFVDGKPFISENLHIATQNLPKSVIEKIQVYQKENPNLAERRADSVLSMNILLKHDRNAGLLTRMTAGYGTSGRYELAANAILYNKQSRLAMAGLSNNINKKISEIQTALVNGTYKNNNLNLSDAPDFDLDGQNRSSFLGAVFQHQIRAKKRLFLENDIHAQLTHGKNRTDLNAEIFQTSLVNNREEMLKSTTVSQSRTDFTDASVSYRKAKMNTGNSISANLTLENNFLDENLQSIKDIDKNRVSENRSHNTISNRAQNIKVNGRYHRTDNEQFGLKSLFINYEISYVQDAANRLADNQFESFVSGISDLSRIRKYKIDRSKLKANVYISYPGIKRVLFSHHDIAGVDMHLINQFRISKKESRQHVTDFDGVSHDFVRNIDLSFRDILDSIQYKPSLSLRKSFRKYLSWRVDRDLFLELNLQGNFLRLDNSSSLAYRASDRSFTFLEPEISVGYKHQNANRRIRLEYQSRIFNIVPEIDQLFPIVDNINPYYIQSGNALLATEQQFLNVFSAEYKALKINHNRNFIASFKTGVTYSTNAISDSLVSDEAGKKIVFPVNVAYRKNWNSDVDAAYSIDLAKNLLQLQYKGSLIASTIPVYMGGQMVISDFTSLNSHFSVGYAFSKWMSMEVSQAIYSHRFILSEGAQRNRLFNTGLHLNLHPAMHLTLSSSFIFFNNPSVKNESALWNIYITWRFLKDEKCELKFSGFDLLKNFKSIKADLGYNFNSTTINSGLQQFFMVSVSYYPRYY